MKTKEQIKETNRKFFDLWARTYDWGISKPWLYSLQKKTVSYLKLKNKLRILDIGCGTGDSLVLLNKLNPNLNLYGLDISGKMLEKANKKLKEKAILKLGEVEKIPFKRNSFDYIITTEAFHHFPNPESALKEIYRVLKKKGKLILTDITFKSKLIKRIFKFLEPGHVKIYTEEEFKELFNKNKLKIIEQKRIGLFVVLTIGQK
ncbi:MAG: methyltransferase domain-containing protein [Nanoarchaeota archaeon]